MNAVDAARQAAVLEQVEEAEARAEALEAEARSIRLRAATRRRAWNLPKCDQPHTIEVDSRPSGT